MIGFMDTRQRILVYLLPVLILLTGCMGNRHRVYQAPSGSIYVTPEAFSPMDDERRRERLDDLAAAMEAVSGCGPVTVRNPYRGAFFPADMAAPRFDWNDPAASRWLLVFSCQSHPERILVVSDEPCWVPDSETWDTALSFWTGKCVSLSILGLSPDSRILTRGTTEFFMSPDPVAAPVLYQQIPLPFGKALKQVSRFKWRLGDIAAYSEPGTVIENPPSCMFCHTVSGNGKTIGMDMDFQGDKGGYILADIRKQIPVTRADIISWNRLPHPENAPNMGLFSKLSHDGDYVVTTVNEKPFMITMDQVDFSQLFFPITGHLAVYARKTGRFFLLPGADDPAFVHTSPVWSPDGRHIIFARAAVSPRLKAVMGNRRLLMKDIKTPIKDLNRLYRIRYDLYAIPFNNGRGGTPVPVRGASFNGSSNYFPRVSPDGKWIVFNRSDTGIVAQPTAELYIVPFGGGTARRMTCNTSHYNSWHSFAPNGRWMVFTSKVNTPYTQLFLTHIDEHGISSPPVLLWRFHNAERAAVIPEFLNAAPDALTRIFFTPLPSAR